MTWLKLIANALWTGVYGALLVAFLFFFLNDELADAGLISRAFGFTLVWSVVIYTPVFALIFPTLYVCLRFFAARRLRIPWLSLKSIVWLGIAVLLAMTIVYYRNLRLAGALLSPSARDALRILCATMAGCWILAVTGAAAAQRRPQGRRTAHRVAAGLLVLAPMGMMILMAPFMAADPPAAAFPLSPRLASIPTAVPGPPDPYGPRAAEPRLLFIALDTASMDFILPLVSARQLPTFERLIKEGASTRLDAFRPCSSSAAWATVMTGMPPWITGVRGRRAFKLQPGAPASIGIVPGALGMPFLAGAGLLTGEPAPALGGKRPTLSQILDAQSIPVSMFGWPDRGQDGEPAPTIALDDSRVTYRLEKILGPEVESTTVERNAIAAMLRKAIATDLSARDAAGGGPAGDGAANGARLVGVRFAGLARVSRSVLRYHLPDEYGDVSPGEIALFGPILTRYYQFLDETIAELIAGQQTSGTLLHVMVVSAHGIAPTSGWERFITPMLSSRRRITPVPSGTWTDGPDGILLIHGPGLRPGARLEGAALVDVLPTALYLLGSPVGHDLRGQLLRRLFEREYLESHPVQIVHGVTARGATGF